MSRRTLSVADYCILFHYVKHRDIDLFLPRKHCFQYIDKVLWYKQCIKTKLLRDLSGIVRLNYRTEKYTAKIDFSHFKWKEIVEMEKGYKVIFSVIQFISYLLHYTTYLNNLTYYIYFRFFYASVISFTISIVKTIRNDFRLKINFRIPNSFMPSNNVVLCILSEV